MSEKVEDVIEEIIDEATVDQIDTITTDGDDLPLGPPVPAD